MTVEERLNDAARQADEIFDEEFLKFQGGLLQFIRTSQSTSTAPQPSLTSSTRNNSRSRCWHGSKRSWQKHWPMNLDDVGNVRETELLGIEGG
jgi:hypothetical protein